MTKFQIVKIKCKICKGKYLKEFPVSYNHAKMDKIEANYTCYNCMKGKEAEDE